jgi:hypothetical protein
LKLAEYFHKLSFGYQDAAQNSVLFCWPELRVVVSKNGLTIFYSDSTKQ